MTSASPRLSWLVAACLLVTPSLVSRTAMAGADDLIIVPASNGQLGAWLGAGPLYGQNESLRFTSTRSGADDSRRVLEVVQGAPVLGSKKLRPLVSSRSSFDLRRAFHSRARNVYAVMAGVLRASKPARVTLVFGADDGLRVTVDGRVVLDRDLWRPPLRDDDAVQLELTSGDHPVIVRLRQRNGAWRFRGRLLSSEDSQPPRDVAWVLPGVGQQSANALTERMVRPKLRWTVSSRGYVPELQVQVPGGVPRSSKMPISVEVLASKSDSAKENSRLFWAFLAHVPTSHGVAGAIRAPLPEIPEGDLGSSPWDGVTFVVHVGDTEKTFSRWVNRRVRNTIVRTRSWLSTPGRLQRLKLLDADVVRSSLELYDQRLSRFVEDGDRDRRAISQETSSVIRWLDALDAGQDPLLLPGPQRLAYRSPLDGKLRPFGVYVPRMSHHSTGKRLPLVVVLHGLNGLPMQMIRIFFGFDDPAHHARWEDRHMPRLPHLDAFVVSPTGFGNLAYRQEGEQDVAHLLAWMKEHYPVDHDRVYVTGLSMGGTGAAAIGLRFADQFAAAEPLCGYHSYKLRRDMRGRKRSWERALGKFWSNTSWAPNGLHLPMYVVQGTKDKPAANSGVLIDAYNALGYSMRHEHPELGHNVWQRTYEKLRGYRWLARHRRDPQPKHVVLSTPSLTYGDYAWLHIDKLERHLEWARVDARITSHTTVRLRTSHTLGLHLERPSRRLATNQPIEVDIDGTKLTFAPDEPIAMHHDGSSWLSGSFSWGPGLHKTRDLTGPIRDIFRRPLLIVYGTRDPAFARANYDVAKTLASPPYGVEARWSVIADRDLTPDQEANHSLLLIGPPRSNSVLARIDRKLPIHVEADGVVVGGRVFHGQGLGTMFIYPNPEHVKNYVVVIEAPTAPGMLRSLSLPRMLPDYVVYDDRVAGARGQVILRNASLLVGGMFDDDWKLSKSTEK